MNWWRVTVTSEQATTIGIGATRAFHTSTAQYIPGSTLRGALAAAWRLRHGDDRPDDFRRLFDGTTRFGPLLAQGSDVTSQSVWHAKYHEGPGKYTDEAFQGHPDGAGSNLRGDIMWEGGSLAIRAVTSTAINETKKTAEEGALWSRAVHRRGLTYTGHIVGDDLIGELDDVKRISIGGRRSVLGRAQFALKQCPAPEPPAGRVVVRTISPTILIDDAGRPSTDFKAALESFGLDVATVWAGRLAPNGTSGWHQASGTPKPEDIALAPGAVAALEVVSPENLTKLLDHGLGVRRAEGFGWVELVPEPWQPPGQAEKTQTPVAGTDWAKSCTGFTQDERRTLADWLQEYQSFDPRLRDTAAGKNFTDQKWEVVKQVLNEVPPGQRNAVASDLRRQP